jgi:hypothetical protein
VATEGSRMSGLFSAFILANVFTAGLSNALPPRKTLAVQLIHRCSRGTACVRIQAIDQMVRETQQIWSSLDVRIAWNDSPRGSLAGADGGLIVFLEEQGAPPAQQDPVLASLGQPLEPCGPALAHVWMRNIRDFIATVAVGGKRIENLPNALADLILGRALGRTLAHEIAHYLLGTGRHSSQGLLRSTFEPYELLEAVGHARYGLSASDRLSLLTCRMDQPARSTDNQP